MLIASANFCLVLALIATATFARKSPLPDSLLWNVGERNTSEECAQTSTEDRQGRLTCHCNDHSLCPNTDCCSGEACVVVTTVRNISANEEDAELNAVRTWSCSSEAMQTIDGYANCDWVNETMQRLLPPQALSQICFCNFGNCNTTTPDDYGDGSQNDTMMEADEEMQCCFFGDDSKRVRVGVGPGLGPPFLIPGHGKSSNGNTNATSGGSFSSKFGGLQLILLFLDLFLVYCLAAKQQLNTIPATTAIGVIVICSCICMSFASPALTEATFSEDRPSSNHSITRDGRLIGEHSDTQKMCTEASTDGRYGGILTCHCNDPILCPNSNCCYGESCILAIAEESNAEIKMVGIQSCWIETLPSANEYRCTQMNATTKIPALSRRLPEIFTDGTICVCGASFCNVLDRNAISDSTLAKSRQRRRAGIRFRGGRFGRQGGGFRGGGFRSSGAGQGWRPAAAGRGNVGGRPGGGFAAGAGRSNGFRAQLTIRVVPSYQVRVYTPINVIYARPVACRLYHGGFGSSTASFMFWYYAMHSASHQHHYAYHWNYHYHDGDHEYQHSIQPTSVDFSAEHTKWPNRGRLTCTCDDSRMCSNTTDWCMGESCSTLTGRFGNEEFTTRGCTNEIFPDGCGEMLKAEANETTKQPETVVNVCICNTNYCNRGNQLQRWTLLITLVYGALTLVV